LLDLRLYPGANDKNTCACEPIASCSQQFPLLAVPPFHPPVLEPNFHLHKKKTDLIGVENQMIKSFPMNKFENRGKEPINNPGKRFYLEYFCTIYILSNAQKSSCMIKIM